jgi:hypothetical protein
MFVGGNFFAFAFPFRQDLFEDGEDPFTHLRVMQFFYRR